MNAHAPKALGFDGKALTGTSIDLAEVEAAERRIRRIGIVIVLIVFLGFGGWAILAPLSAAAHASGTVSVENYRKTIQHLEGGIVKAIHVHDGQHIARNELLISLDDTQARSEYEVVRGQYFGSLARDARLIAQRDNLPSIRFPDELLKHSDDPRVRDTMALQEQTFRARAAAYHNEAAALRQKIDQLHAQSSGVKAQKSGRERTVKSYSGELTDYQKLLADGYADKQRVRELERNLADAEAQYGELEANLSSIDAQVTEANLRILQLQRDFQREVAQELGECETQLFEQRSRLQRLESTLARTEIRSPYDGVVLNLNVHAVGGVIGSGEKILDIVPQNERLVIEAHVSPLDIDRVHAGQVAEVRLPAFKSRKLPKIEGKLVDLSADSLVDQRTENPQPYYLARIEVSPEGLKALHNNKFVLVAGMPAEILIKTGERSLFSYLIEPLRDSARRAFIED